MKHLNEYATYDDDFTEMIKAVKAGDIERVEYYVYTQGVNPSDHDSLALSQAADGGYSDIIKLFLEDGRVDINANNSRAVQYAALGNHKESVELLVDDGISVETVMHVIIACKWNRWHDILDKVLATDNALKYVNAMSFNGLDDNIKDSLKRIYDLDSDEELKAILTLMKTA